MANRSSNYTAIQHSFTLFLSFQQEKLYLQEKIEVSKSGIMANVSRLSHYLPFQSGVYLSNRMEILFVEQVTVKSESSPATRLVSHRSKISLNSTPKYQVLSSPRNH